MATRTNKTAPAKPTKAASKPATKPATKPAPQPTATPTPQKAAATGKSKTQAASAKPAAAPAKSAEGLVLKLYYALGVESGVILLGAYPAGQPPLTAMGYVLAASDAQIVFSCRPPKTGAFVSEVAESGSAKGAGYQKFAAYLPGAELAKTRQGHFVALWKDGEIKRFDAEIVAKKSLPGEHQATVQLNFGRLLKQLSASVMPAPTKAAPAPTKPAAPPAAAIKKAGATAPAPATKAVQPNPPPAPKTSVVGQFEGIRNGYAEGWAYDPAHPDRHPTVEIFDGQRVVARGVANNFRQDLVKNGVGDGTYAFKLRVSFELKDNLPHTLSARAAGQPGMLGGGSHTFVAPPEHFADYDLVDRATTLKFAARQLEGKGTPAERTLLLNRLEAACIDLEMLDLGAATKSFIALFEPFGQHGFLGCKVAETLFIGQRFDDAVKACKQALKRTPKLAWAYWSLGNAHRLAKAWDEAETAYREGLAITPGSRALQERLAAVRPLAGVARAERLLKEGKTAAAVDLLKTLLDDAPDNLDIFKALKRAMATRDNTPPENTPQPELVTAFEAALYALDAALDQAEKKAPALRGARA